MRTLVVRFDMLPRIVLCCIFAAAVFSLSCEKDDKYDYRVLGPGEDEKQIDIMLVSGNNQTGVVDEPLQDSLVVYVSENYIPKQAWTVEFKVVQGEGTLSPASNITDVKGYTATTLTPTGLPGEIKVEATPFYSDQSVIFTATSIAQ
ncbi:MAG: hypothetical protein JRK26_23800 [Deltaproteobacteria bacterium]|nr:hypothetical protein [Deltaproteobacteria bacterium]